MSIPALRDFAFVASSLLAVLSNTPASAQEARMIVSHEVEDFERWKQVFDQALPIRRAAGEMTFAILQSPTNEALVTVWFEWDTMERARAWASDPILANGMAAAGVISEPVFSFSVIEPTY
ncbi:MAG: hypothetical protein AAF498_03900 [Pseudomonadota bacterium]